MNPTRTPSFCRRAPACRPVRSGRGPLYNYFRGMRQLAGAATRTGAPPPDELLAMHRQVCSSRRRFLKRSAALSLAFLGAPAAGGRVGSGGARVVVVGAGLAGLSAAFWLRRRGGVAATG